jgi:YbgC/YbaW family acyl-CoA thioester hydrolase
MTSYKIDIEVHWPDLDSARVVYFPTYIKWFEAALFYGLLRSKGISFTDDYRIVVGSEVRNTTFVVGEYCCRINAPSKLHDLLELHVNVKEILEKTITFNFNLFKRGGSEKLANGHFTLVHTDLENWKAVEIPENIKKLFRSS